MFSFVAPKYGRYLFVLGLVFVGINLRAPITCVGPVVPELQEVFGLSSALAGLITTIPLLMFAVLSPFASVFAGRFGIASTVWFALFAILFGLLLRIGGLPIMLYVGTAFIGAGIAMCNVLVPPLVKQHFPQRMGLLTGLYSVSMGLAASLASGLSISIGRWTGYGWKGSLGFWIGGAVLGILVWSLLRKQIGTRAPSQDQAGAKRTGFGDYLRMPKAWCVTFFMGTQSLLFYCAVAWLPVVLQEWGMSSEQSGWALSFIPLSQLPVMFVAPIFIARMRDHRPLLWVVGLTLVAGVLLMQIFRLTYVWPAVILYGIGSGVAFSLVMMWFVMRTATTGGATKLSGMAQSFGYAIAAAAPPLFGMVHDWSGSWDLPLMFLLVMSILLVLSGVPIARPGYIDADRKRR